MNTTTKLIQIVSYITVPKLKIIRITISNYHINTIINNGTNSKKRKD